MKRAIYQNLIAWKAKKDRKPLLLKGIRQAGKTYCLEKFGRQQFNKTHVVNFEYGDAKFHKIFKPDLNPDRILNELRFVLDTPIDENKDLLFFDEIQACPRAITSLKYFCEKKPKLAVCAAGSLLGLKLNSDPFPVGKVDMMTLYPLSFIEFLQALNDEKSIEFIQTCHANTKTPDVIHEHLWERLKWYFITGGLPEVVRIFCAHHNNLFDAFERVRKKQKELIAGYYADITKHSGKENAMQIARVWQSVPQQLARSLESTSQRFQFSGIVPGVDRYQRLVGAIDWLIATGLVIKTHITKNPELPLSAFCKESLFKLYFCDVGLLGAISELPPDAILEYNYGTYKGYFAENFIAQEFQTYNMDSLYCWQTNRSEVEFLSVVGSAVIPIEVKSGWITRATSLDKFVKLFSPPFHVIMGAGKLDIDKATGRHQYPLYLATRFPELSM